MGSATAISRMVLFYGEKAIRVTKVKGAYVSIDDGNHRVWLAKRMGIRTLPVRVIDSPAQSRGH